jgi:hypothetical protein
MAPNECGLKKQKSKSKLDFSVNRTNSQSVKGETRKVHLNAVWRTAVSKATQVILTRVTTQGKKLLPTKTLMAKK